MNRITLLYQDESSLFQTTDINATHIVVTNHNNDTLYVQNTTVIYDNTGNDFNDLRSMLYLSDATNINQVLNKKEPFRITIDTSPISSFTSQQLLIKPLLFSGLNVYTSDNHNSTSFIDSKFHQVYHSNNLDVIFDLLPKQFIEDYLYDLNNNQNISYDIIVNKVSIIISKYYNPFQQIGNNTPQIFSISQDSFNKRNKNKEGWKNVVGLFYPDLIENGYNFENLISLNGLDCSFPPYNENENEDDHRLKCNKRSFFYQTAFSTNEREIQVTFKQPVGLHPVLQVDLNSITDKADCKPFVFMQLPKTLFVDKFQSNPVFLFGEDDLELPVYKIKKWGSEVLFELEFNKSNEITLHSRYMSPANNSNNITTPYFEEYNVNPYVFVACDNDNSQDTNSNPIMNPFYEKHFGLQDFFTPNTNFQLLSFSLEKNLTTTVPIPTININSYDTIRYSIWTVMTLSIIYLLNKIFHNDLLSQQKQHQKEKK
ncbi:Pbn1p SCDLUD_003817 [Saccharomycodes ludwigii]|uniref:Pbn1p n=1 Tax=Saccharomycodes ludwigii TaxID=36035 RepID=UPI001E84B93F|nr:hypothetical protein SCDLUD_003817 [Saccharomycodes ludwigii]KAH3899540.1 hypothetical protein SCDLUD_003817 [Saccharomycodes ludwigii]